MSTRPTVSHYNAKENAPEVAGQLPMPAVFSAPIRDDVVAFVHSNMAKNRR